MTRIRRNNALAPARRMKEIVVGGGGSPFLGLNTTNPYARLKDGESPYLYNVRLYPRNSTDRRVAVGTRKGPGFYSVPLGETVDQQVTSTTGAAQQSFDTTNWITDKFTAGASGRLTKIDIKLALGTTTPTQHAIVAAYTNNSGKPGTLIGTSSILSSSTTGTATFLSARLTEAPQITSGTVYWVVLYMQMGGEGNYLVSSTTSATTALTSNNSGGTWSSTSFALNIKDYVSTNAKILGADRFTPSGAAAKSLIATGTAVYTVSEVDGSTSSIATGLSASGANYYFAQTGDKIYWVNGFDAPRSYDGTTVASVTSGSPPPNGKFLAFHKNRLFLQDPTDPTKIVFSELGDYTTYLSTNFIYAPAPKSGDPVVGFIVFQDNLIIFTRKTKYVLFGDDPGNFVLRQSSGKKGAVNQDVIKADANYVYFLSDDGIYRYNGSSDELISDNIQTDVDGMTDKTKASAIVWKNYYRVYYPSTGSSANNSTLLWDTINTFWLRDSNTFIDKPFVNESDQLIEGSSLVGAVYRAEQAYSDLGKPIQFKYWTKYYGDGVHKFMLRRIIPSILLQTQPYNLTVLVDLDQRNTASLQYTIPSIASGLTWGGGSTWGSGGSTIWGSSTVSTPKVLRGSEAYWQQIRYEQTGVDTPVEILSQVLQIRSRRTE